MAFSMAGGGPFSPQINVTPLIDVLLVLIIIFMVVVTQEKERGLRAEIPQPAPDQQTQASRERTIVVQLLSGTQEQPPTLKINQQAVSWEQPHGQLQQIFNARAEKVVFVRGDDEISFQYVADVIDIAHNSGVERVGLLGNEYARAIPGTK